MNQQSPNFSFKAFENQISKRMNLSRFYPFVEAQLKILGSMTCLHKTFEGFIKQQDVYIDDKWSFFKLMMSFDLFGVIDVLFLSGQALKDYIDRLYQPYHYTSLRNDKSNFDDPEKIVDQIIQQSYRQSRLSYLLEIVIGLHLDIKQQSLVNQHFNQQRVFKKYETIQKHMQQINTIILKRNLQQEDFNEEIQNNQNKFLEAYYKTTDVFKTSLQDFKLILQYEQMLYEFQQVYSTSKNKSLVDENIHFERVIKMFNLIQTLEKKFREKKKEQIKVDHSKIDIEKQTQQNPSPAPKKRFQKKPTTTNMSQKIQVEKLQQEYEQLIKIFLPQYKSDPFQIIDLLKLNMIKYIIQKAKIRASDISFFRHFIKLKLFNSKITKSLWCDLENPVLQIVAHIEKNSTFQCLKQQNSLIKFAKMFDQEQIIRSKQKIIDNIFKQVDLLIASEICGSWNEIIQISNVNKILVVGKTKAGKSSLINFLSKRKIMSVGTTLVSKTFYPEFVNINIGDQTWEWWDLPGLMDTRSFIFRLCIGFFLKCIVDSSVLCKIKFVLVSKNYQLYDVQSYAKTIKLFGSLFQWNSQKVNSLFAIYTHIQSIENIQQFHENEQNKMKKTNYKIFLEKITRISNISQQKQKQFYQNLLQQVFLNIQFFTFQDNNSPLGQSQSRGFILELAKQTKIVQKISVQPVIFLQQSQSDFLKHFNIQFRAKEYLNPKKDDSNDLFLKLFTIIQSFRKINTNSIKNEYKFIKQELRILYQTGIHDSFVKLNELNVEENKTSQFKTNIVNQIIKYHLKFYFVSFEQKIREILDSHKIASESSKIIIDKTVMYCNNQKISLEQQIRIILQQIDNNRVKDIVNKIIKQADQFKITGKKAQQNNVNNLLKYISSIANNNREKQPLKTSILELQQKLIQTPLRSQYLKILDQDQTTSKTKLTKFYKQKQNNYIQTTLLNVIEQISNSKNSEERSQMMIQHFLELLSKDNYESNIKIDLRYNKLFPSDKIQNSSKLLRLDLYGQCICNKDVYFSDFLKINTIKAKKINEEEQTIYVFSQYSFIKLFCTKLIIDIENITIKCKQSFCIIADQVQFKHQKHTINALKFNNEPATFIISLKNNDSQNERKQLSLKIKLNQKTDRQFMNDRQKIQFVQRFGTLVSRTLIDSAVYSQIYYYDPSFSYAFIQNNDVSHNRIILKIKTTSSAFTSKKSLQFGQLHLKKLVQNKIAQQKKNNSKHVSEESLLTLTKICHDIVEYVKNRFDQTTIRIRYEHFNTVFCKKISQLIFLCLFENINLLSVKRSCFKMMKQQMFAYIFDGMINILQSQYNKLFGRHYSNRKIQADSIAIKKYCQNLLELPLHRFQKQNQQQDHLRTLAKKFTIQFQKSMFYSIQQKLSYTGMFMNFIYIFKNPNETQEDKKNKLTYDTNYIQQNVKRLKFLQTVLVNQQKQKFQTNDQLGLTNSNINKSEADHFVKSRKQASLLCQKYQFSQLINIYQKQKDNIFKGKQDQIHSYIGYAYLKKRKYKEAENQFRLLSAQNSSSDKHKILFDILSKKYPSISKSLINNQQQQLKENSLTKQEETFDQLMTSYDKSDTSSLTRYNNRDRNYFNILSLDSGKFNNHIVNTIFVSQIQKHTKRPIMHMFDMVICKNSSALLGAALTIPTRTQLRDSNTYEINLFPQFTACSFILSSQKILSGYDEQMSLKTNFKQDYDFKSLHTSLAIMRQNQKQKMKQIISTFNYSQKSLVGYRNIYDIVSKTVAHVGKQFQVDPLFDMYNQEMIPTFKSSRTIDILSLGTGRYYSQIQKQFMYRTDLQRIRKFDRWQLYLEDSQKMQQLKLDDYIQLTRMMIQQKWINQTKQMRNLMDKLEDKPTIKDIKQRQ